MAGLRVHFVFPAVLVERVDAARGDVSRGEFVRRAVELALIEEALDAEQALSEAKEPYCDEQADSGSVPSSEGVRSATPAERPLPRSANEGPAPANLAAAVPYRQANSSQAKRSVQSRPKKGKT